MADRRSRRRAAWSQGGVAYVLLESARRCSTSPAGLRGVWIDGGARRSPFDASPLALADVRDVDDLAARVAQPPARRLGRAQRRRAPRHAARRQRLDVDARARRSPPKEPTWASSGSRTFVQHVGAPRRRGRRRPRPLADRALADRARRAETQACGIDACEAWTDARARRRALRRAGRALGHPRAILEDAPVRPRPAADAGRRARCDASADGDGDRRRCCARARARSSQVLGEAPLTAAGGTIGVGADRPRPGRAGRRRARGRRVARLPRSTRDARADADRRALGRGVRRRRRRRAHRRGRCAWTARARTGPRLAWTQAFLAPSAVGAGRRRSRRTSRRRSPPWTRPTRAPPRAPPTSLPGARRRARRRVPPARCRRAPPPASAAWPSPDARVLLFDEPGHADVACRRSSRSAKIGADDVRGLGRALRGARVQRRRVRTAPGRRGPTRCTPGSSGTTRNSRSPARPTTRGNERARWPTSRGELTRALPALRAQRRRGRPRAYARDLWPRHHMAVRAGHPARASPGRHRLAVVHRGGRARRALGARRAACRSCRSARAAASAPASSPREDVVVVDLKRLARIRGDRRGGASASTSRRGTWACRSSRRSSARASRSATSRPRSSAAPSAAGSPRAAPGSARAPTGRSRTWWSSLECVTGSGRRGRAAPPHERARTSCRSSSAARARSPSSRAPRCASTRRLRRAASARGPSRPRRDGWEAMRALFQAGLRPAVARLYDPFDAMLAQAGRREGGAAMRARRRSCDAPVLRRRRRCAPSFAARRRSTTLLHSGIAARAMGGAMLVVIFEGTGRGRAARHRRRRGRSASRRAARGRARPRRAAGSPTATRSATARRRSSRNGAFVDTMEVAARWSSLGDLYEGVRRALGEHVFVMAHFSHAYPDGCCIYFSFVGSADPGLVRELGLGRGVRGDLRPHVEGGARGGGRGGRHAVAPPRRRAARRRRACPRSWAAGIDVVRSLMRAFDPGGILNPGNLVAVRRRRARRPSQPAAHRGVPLDRESLLACIEGGADLAAAERRLNERGPHARRRRSLAVRRRSADWLARGAPGARDRWLDPADQLLAGLDATLAGGRRLPFAPRLAARSAPISRRSSSAHAIASAASTARGCASTAAT